MEYKSRIYSCTDTMLRHEKCKKCGEWMHPYITVKEGHAIIQRECNCQDNKESKDDK